LNGFTLYQANCYQNERNAYYPGEVEVGTLEQLLSVSEKDHTAGRFKNSHRAVDDFISSNCIMGDLDNGETDNEDFFKTVDDIAEAFPDVCFYYVFSRNHLKVKKRSDGTYLAPRYKVHVYFPLSREYADAVKYNKLQFALGFLFPYFDAGASDAARFFYGVRDPDRTDRGGVIEGALCIDEYLKQTFKHGGDYRRACENALDNAVEEASRDNPGWRDDKLAWKDLKEWCKRFSEATRTPDKALPECKTAVATSGSAPAAAKNNVAVQELIYEVKSFLKRHDLPDEPEQQGEYFRFPVPCPWCDHHTTDDANGPRSRLIVSPTRYGGATITFKCFHSSCQEYHHNDKWMYFQHYGELFEHGNITPINSSDQASNNGGQKGKVSTSGNDTAGQPVDIKLASVEGTEETEPEWLIPGYMPKGQITVLVGDGGSGKTSLWCEIVAALTSGRQSVFDKANGIPWKAGNKGKVIFFSSEDSVSSVLKRRLRKAGADVSKTFYLDLADPLFDAIKFNSESLAALIEKERPDLVIFDPLQSFVPPEIQMGSRNAMRQCLSPLIGLGERFGTSFLIIMHTNKKQGVSGRTRMADSSDVWDIARSVMIAGYTGENKVRYLSHEKNNYGETSPTILFTVDENGVQFKGTSDKHDREYVAENAEVVRSSPARNAAKESIMSVLSSGQEVKTSDLDEVILSQGVSFRTLARAKTELKREGKIRFRCEGFNPKTFYVKSALLEGNTK